MKQQLNKNEIDLIKEWKRNPRQDIALYFFEKYKDDVLNIIYAKINRKFSSIPLEKGDFFHLVWKSVLTSLSKYKLDSKYNFENILILNTYNASIKEALKFITNNHIILNTSYSYESILEKNQNYNFGLGGKDFINSNFNDARKKLIDHVLTLNKSYSIDFIKKLIYLKSNGHSINEICEIMNKPLRYIRGAIEYIVKIAKKLYD